MQNKKGTYILVIKVTNHVKTQIGQLGKLELSSGIYLYIGSALGTGSTSLHHRISRHLLQANRNKNHWHIDYITALDQVKILKIIVIESTNHLECSISENLAQLPNISYPMRGVGSSDCSRCKSHFYSYNGSINQTIEDCRKIIKNLGFNLYILSPGTLSNFTK